MIKARRVWLPIVLALIVVGCRSPKPTQKETVSETATVPEGLRTVDPKQKQFESEGKTMVSAMNRSTQAFFMEKSMLPTAFSQLAIIGLDLQSPHYQYDVKSIGSNGIQLIGRAKSADLKSYTGGVFIKSLGNEKTTVDILCEAAKPGMGDLPAPQFVNNQLTCSEGTVRLSR